MSLMLGVLPYQIPTPPPPSSRSHPTSFISCQFSFSNPNPYTTCRSVRFGARITLFRHLSEKLCPFSRVQCARTALCRGEMCHTKMPSLGLNLWFRIPATTLMLALLLSPPDCAPYVTNQVRQYFPGCPVECFRSGPGGGGGGGGGGGV